MKVPENSLGLRARWLIVATYAIAMAWVESAVVYDLRTLVHRIQPYQADPLPMIGGLGPVELVREFATMIMLITIGLLAGRTWRSRLGYSALAFGIWDIFYYLFLHWICGWPYSLLDWDILFLLPLPWWGPVLAPVLIAILMIVWGTIATQSGRARPIALSNVTAWGLNSLGVILALYVFMEDTLRVANQGTEVIRMVLPTRFNWPLFSVALLLMASPILEVARQAWPRRTGSRLPVPSSEEPA